jgi:hypothetical protein
MCVGTRLTTEGERARTRERPFWRNLFMKRETKFQMEFDDIAFVNGNSAVEVLCRGEQATQKGEEHYEAHEGGGGGGSLPDATQTQSKHSERGGL